MMTTWELHCLLCFTFSALMLQNPQSKNQILQSLASFLGGVVLTIIIIFHYIYTRVSLANRGAKIGLGVGGCIGVIGFHWGLWGAAAGIVVGGLLLGLIGSGIYGEHPSDQTGRESEGFMPALLSFLAGGNRKVEQ